MYHRRSMGTMRYSKWRGARGGVSHFYNRTAMVEEVPASSRSGASTPITLIDRQMMSYVHRTRERHFQLFRSYQQKTNSTECKLREGEMLRRRWHRRLQKAFITYMQFETKKVLEKQAELVHQYGQASVNAALGDPHASLGLGAGASLGAASESAQHGAGSSGGDGSGSDSVRQRKISVLRRSVTALPSLQMVPKHVATMKQIHNDRFNYRWRVN